MASFAIQSCRACMLQDNEVAMYDLHEPETLHIFKECSKSNIQPNEDPNLLPQFLCGMCYRLCELMHNFRDRCSQTENKLMQQVKKLKRPQPGRATILNAVPLPKVVTPQVQEVQTVTLQELEEEVVAHPLTVAVEEEYQVEEEEEEEEEFPLEESKEEVPVYEPPVESPPAKKKKRTTTTPMTMKKQSRTTEDSKAVEVEASPRSPKRAANKKPKQLKHQVVDMAEDSPASKGADTKDWFWFTTSKSIAWKHFMRDPTKTYAKCVHCNAVIKSVNGTTGSLMNHLRLKHDFEQEKE